MPADWQTLVADAIETAIARRLQLEVARHAAVVDVLATALQTIRDGALPPGYTPDKAGDYLRQVATDALRLGNLIAAGTHDVFAANQAKVPA